MKIKVTHSFSALTQQIAKWNKEFLSQRMTRSQKSNMLHMGQKLSNQMLAPALSRVIGSDGFSMVICSRAASWALTRLWPLWNSHSKGPVFNGTIFKNYILVQQKWGPKTSQKYINPDLPTLQENCKGKITKYIWNFFFFNFLSN